MADNQHIEVINQTPLLLIVEHVRSGKDAAAIGDIAPLDHLVKDIAGDGALVVRDKVSRVEVRRADVAAAPSPLIVTPGDLRSGEESDKPRPHALTITNSTDHYVDMHYIYPDGEDQWFGPRLAPGQKIVHQTSPHECVLFYSVFTGGLLAAIITNDSPASSVEITSKYVDLQHKQANRPPDPHFGELKLVGHARKPRPATSKDYISRSEHTFLPSAALKEEAPFVQFNTLVGRLLRHVAITGVDLCWDGSDTSGLNAYSAVRGVDGAGSGGGNLDIRSLTIHADRVTIAIPLWFPRTDVTIYARELIFQGRGCIDTTPYPFKAKAVSEKYVQDENGNVYPADDHGNAVYRGADGRDGETAGRIELFVRDIRGLDGQARFIACGSRGQEAEDGGHEPYVAKDNQPKDGRDVAGITFEQINELVLDKTAIRADYLGSWPGNALWPGQIPDADLQAKMKAGQIGHLKLGIWSSDSSIGTLSSRRVDCYFLPSRKTEHAPHFRTLSELNTWFDSVEDSGPLPGDGEDAYASGKPGKGGDGGVVTSHFVSIGTAQVDGGKPGPTSKTIDGGEPGKTTFWLTLKVKLHNNDNPLRRGDNIQLTAKSGLKGKAAEGIAQEEKAKAGKVLPPDNQPPLGWLHELSLEALLTYAADAFRKGCNDDARRALEPYYALLTAPDVKAIPDRLTSQWVALNAMRTNLNNNTDYYGNPPGWIPRLAVTTSYETFQAVRRTASESLFFALKMADDYDALQQADDLATRTTQLVEKELDEVQEGLRDAYKQIAEAQKKVEEVQKKLSIKGQELTRLKARVDDIAKHKVEIQRAFSAACQLVGGLMNICPVGQPILRGIGNVFAVGSTFDWNKKNPWEEAGKTFEKIGGSIDDFMEKNEEVLTKADSGDALSAKQRALNLGLQLGDMKAALQEDTAKVRSTMAGLDATQRPALTQEMERLQTKIQEALRTSTVPEPLKFPINGWAKAVAHAAATKGGEKIASDIAAYRAELKQLMDQRFAVTQTIMSMKDASGKRFPKEQVKDAVKLLTDGEVNGLLAHTKAIEELGAQRRKAELEVKGYKLENKRAAEKKKEVLERVKGLGDGVANIGAAIAKAAAPFDENDPAVRSLVQRMLDSKDSEFHPIYEKLKDELMKIAEEKKREAAKLMQSHQTATALTGKLSGSLDMLDRLGRERQSLSGVLEAGTRTFLKGMEQRARAALQQSIYNFVQAYQYEFLSDPGDDFFSFDDWVERLRKLETEKKILAQGRLDTARKNNASASDLAKAQQDVDRVIRLGEGDFKKVEEEVLKDQLLTIVVKLLTKREHESPPKENKYEGCVFTEAMLQKLNATGEVNFNFVKDWSKGSFNDTEFRAVDVVIDKFEVSTRDENLSLRIWIHHSGKSVILTREAGKPVYYGFQARENEAIAWGFTWNQPLYATTPPVPDIVRKPPIDELLTSLLEKRVSKVEEYKPGMFSDFRFKIDDFPIWRGKVIVTNVVLGVTFQDHGPI